MATPKEHDNKIQKLIKFMIILLIISLFAHYLFYSV